MSAVSPSATFESLLAEGPQQPNSHWEAKLNGRWKVTLGREEMPGKEVEEKREWVPGKSRLEDTCLCTL